MKGPEWLEESGFFKEEELVKVRILSRDPVTFSFRGTIPEALWSLHFYFLRGFIRLPFITSSCSHWDHHEFPSIKLKNNLCPYWMKRTLWPLETVSFDLFQCCMSVSSLALLPLSPENVGAVSPSPLTLTQHLGAPHLISHNLQTPTGKLHLPLPWETLTQDIQNWIIIMQICSSPEFSILTNDTPSICHSKTGRQESLS